MNIAFIMDPWENLKPEIDSSLLLIMEALKRGHTVGITCPNNLGIRNSITLGNFKIIQKPKQLTKALSFYKNVVFKEKLLPVSGFDVVFLRADPPIDNIMLNFLDTVKDDTFIINDIDGLRKANNKLYHASFYDPENKYIPITHVSKNKDYLKRIIKESKNDKMILKPLNGFGGRGVIVIEKEASQNINSLLDFYIHGKEESNYVIIQEYIEGAEKGDVRVMLLNGEPIGAMRRVPAKDDIRSNISAGGSIVKHKLSSAEKEICKKLGPRLVQDGLFLVGLDIINNKVIEINVTSPGGIPMINKLSRSIKIQSKIIDFAEKVVNDNHSALHRKLEHRSFVSNIS
ncbi:MAG: glutathione synthase [Marinilabiliales bacterium]|nr:MAG: glutathione synthase [Marinilabiliales bacterium]